jgi:hypothetical protein
MNECNVTVIEQMGRAIKLLVFFIGTKLVSLVKTLQVRQAHERDRWTQVLPGSRYLPLALSVTLIAYAGFVNSKSATSQIIVKM